MVGEKKFWVCLSLLIPGQHRPWVVTHTHTYTSTHTADAVEEGQGLGHGGGLLTFVVQEPHTSGFKRLALSMQPSTHGLLKGVVFLMCRWWLLVNIFLINLQLTLFFLPCQAYHSSFIYGNKSEENLFPRQTIHVLHIDDDGMFMTC